MPALALIALLANLLLVPVPASGGERPAPAAGPRIATLTAPPVHLGSLSLHDGTWLPGPPPPDASQIFDNRSTNGGVYYPGPGVVVLDYGQLSSAPENEVFAANIGYATASTAPVDIVLRLHVVVGGAGDPGDAVYVFPLSGLPGSPDGTLTAFTLEVFFTERILPDGGMGWSYEVLDASTGVLLVDPDVETGIDDAVSLFDTNLVWQATINFGTDPFASLYLGLVGSYPGVLGWDDLGDTLPGTAGYASLLGAGTLGSDSVNLLDLSSALSDVTTRLIIGFAALDAPFKGGVLVPSPTLILPVPAGPTGHWQIPLLLRGSVPPGIDLYVQIWFPDAGNPFGWAASNAVLGTTS